MSPVYRNSVEDNLPIASPITYNLLEIFSLSL